jgi:hypothetical protein
MCTYLFRDKMISYELSWWLLLLHLYRVAAVNAWLRDGTASLERGRGVRAHAHMYTLNTGSNYLEPSFLLRSIQARGFKRTKQTLHRLVFST